MRGACDVHGLIFSLCERHQNFQIAITGRDLKRGETQMFGTRDKDKAESRLRLNYAIREFVGRAADSGPAAKSGA